MFVCLSKTLFSWINEIIFESIWSVYSVGLYGSRLILNLFYFTKYKSNESNPKTKTKSEIYLYILESYIQNADRVHCSISKCNLTHTVWVYACVLVHMCSPNACLLRMTAVVWNSAYISIHSAHMCEPKEKKRRTSNHQINTKCHTSNVFPIYSLHTYHTGPKHDSRDLK